MRPHRFAVILASVLILLHASLFFFLKTHAGPGRFWLGDTIMNGADQAMYLNDIEQITSGANSLQNYFAPLPQTSFWHPIFVPIGYVARFTGLSTLWAHEIAMWATIAVSILLLHAVSRRMTANERDARLATLLVVFGGGLGWAYVPLFGPHGLIMSLPDAAGDVIGDITGEAYYFPTLLMGAHLPLSFALLPYALLRCWTDIAQGWRHLWKGVIAMGLLLWIHPYFYPLVAIFGFMLLAKHRHDLKTTFTRALPYAAVGLIALLPNLWMVLTNPSKQFLLATDTSLMPLPPWHAWIFAFAPWIILLSWRFLPPLMRGSSLRGVRRRGNPEAMVPAAGPGLPRQSSDSFLAMTNNRERWIYVWLVAAFLAILLPFQWDRKLTQAFGAALIWLSMPVILRLRDHLRTLGRIFPAAGLLIVCATPIFLIRTQLAWATGFVGRGDAFYMSDEVGAAWRWLRTEHGPGAVVMPDDIWIGVWTPAYARQPVWIGHDMETPNWKEKKQILEQIFETAPPEKALELLKEAAPDFILTTSREHAERIYAITDGTWGTSWRSGDMEIFANSKELP